MRADLAKCTTEKERAGARGKCFKTKYRGKVAIHPDLEHDYLNEFGGFRSSARRRHWEHKEFTDVLNPLRGAIRKNLGRSWDKVFSEFCQVLDRRGVSGYHIWTHLMQEVETKTFRSDDGKIYEFPKYSFGPREVDGFYVHPESGLLCYRQSERSKAWYREHRKREVTDVAVPGNESWFYREIDGLWFRCLIVNRKDYWGITEKVITQKRSANKKEIAWVKTQLESNDSQS